MAEVSATTRADGRPASSGQVQHFITEMAPADADADISAHTSLQYTLFFMSICHVSRAFRSAVQCDNHIVTRYRYGSMSQTLSLGHTRPGETTGALQFAQVR